MRDAVPVLVPQNNPNDDSAVLVRWEVELGSMVGADQPIATLETTKSAFEVVAPAAGYLQADLQPGEIIEVGTAFAWITETREAPLTARAAERATPGPDPSPNPARMTRKAQKLLRAHGLTLSDLQGTRAADSAISAADVERAVRGRDIAARAGSRAKRSHSVSAPSDNAVPSDVQRLEQLPSKILEIKLLGEVYATAIPSTVTAILSVERVAAHLRALTAEVGPLSLLEVVIHGTAQILNSFPELNSFYVDGQAFRHRTVSIGFAVNLGRSLRVPVIRDSDKLTPLEIARRVRDLSLRYARNELTIEDVAGGTFTVTDLSAFDVVNFVPVLNHRQGAILGICAERTGSGTRELVLTFDHRLTDGMQAARFLAALREFLEGARGP